MKKYLTKENIVEILINNGYTESTLEAYCELIIIDSCYYYGAIMLNNVPKWKDAVLSLVGKELDISIDIMQGRITKLIKERELEEQNLERCAFSCSKIDINRSIDNINEEIREIESKILYKEINLKKVGV